MGRVERQGACHARRPRRYERPDQPGVPMTPPLVLIENLGRDNEHRKYP
jgi:hypothetical protein